MKIERVSNKHLGELLIERGTINKDQLNTILEAQKASPNLLFGEVLVNMGFGTEEDIAQALTCQYGFPYLPLSNYEIDPDILSSVPVSICDQFCLIPIDKIGKSLTLAMSNPLNVKAVDDVELLTGCSVQAFVSTGKDIRDAIRRYYPSSQSAV
jgi:type IV pilus assembly protein PilB